jgi:hypothetical protein
MEIQDEINLTHLGSPRRDTKLSVLLGRVLINQGAADQGALDVRYASDSGEKRTWPMVRVGPEPEIPASGNAQVLSNFPTTTRVLRASSCSHRQNA